MNRKLMAMLLAVAALAVAGCGDDDDEDTGGGATTETQPTTQATTTEKKEPKSSGGTQRLKADADPNGELRFTVDSLSSKPGKITITMDNPSQLPHAIELEGSGVEEKGETVQTGGTSTVTATVKPGEYEFYCPVPGHKEGGMEGTLTVK